MNFQVTVLKVLVSYPDGFAVLEDIKRDMAILATSGRDWAERTKRLAARVPDLDIFSQRLIERRNGGWRITDKGREVLAVMEARPAPAQPMELPDARAVEEPAPATTLSPMPSITPVRRLRKQTRRQALRQLQRARARS
ncbi:MULTISPECIES: hypothetical protein [Bradyrhizobium]|uniref:Restriction system protein Mrr-like N-terminal domain-containing protein n=3 Tax=Bradyrhizobium TaxID=374 RepID=A0A410VIZ8_9BRAD|nr:MULTISPECIES: hypothetical protein [Bradyrhizobium]MCG2629465.1 hypothetical protein [Bradyrhizobium zhengyangense]MCG2644907.1 hypothetical protein [Bradyrhizobium zhengyangense]MCG2670979.1 hypothetical protein [Bradyrhizobium zhengyangense]MDN4984614.1 hypothetical protein [Bradyrhizobium sp. WYCCWR 13022]MDN5002606.1 hypothetical protein [Bradyrhizobium sp. WYCCWR 12677]